MKYIFVIFTFAALFSATYAHAATEPEISQAAQLAGEYIVRMTGEEGKYVYEFDPATGEDLGGYNILRHGGTIYALLEWYKVSGDGEALMAAQRAIAYLFERVIPCPNMEDALCVIERNEIKLGGNGLALLALATYEQATGDDQYRETAEQLAEWIVGVQNEAGDFTIHKMDMEGRPDDFRSEYYPGEAMYGLMRLYELDQNETWLEAVQQGSTHIIASRKDTYFKNLPADHWLLYALNELHKVDPDERYALFAERTAWQIILSQVRAGVARPEFTGGFYDPPRGAPTATRMEGLHAAHAMFERTNRTYTQQATQNSLALGIDFLVRLQLSDKRINSYSFVPESLGGVPATFDDHSVRIDYVQHALSAFIGND